jgi:hypothetical protein
MTDAKNISPIVEDLRRMQVSIALPCTKCGYDLQGLAADLDCPECSKPIRLTIFEVVDPASTRLGIIPNPKAVGNSIVLVVFFFLCSMLLAIFSMYALAPSLLPVLLNIHPTSVSLCVWAAAIAGLIALFTFIPLIRMRRQVEFQTCRRGISLTGVGLAAWAIAMAIVAIDLYVHPVDTYSISMMYDMCIPGAACVIVFFGFRGLVPRLGQRSLAFRQAQSSRQRMNVMLATLVVFVVGRVIIQVFSTSVYRGFGLILVVMSMLMIIVGLMTLLRNVVWIRNSLISPPPALDELLKTAD